MCNITASYKIVAVLGVQGVMGCYCPVDHGSFNN